MVVGLFGSRRISLLRGGSLVRRSFISFVSLFVLLSLIGVGLYLGLTRTGDQPGSLEDLTAVEIREYEGESLSSIADFRENSIRGPQLVDLDTYSLKVTGLVENPARYSFQELVDDFTNYQKVVTLHCVEGWSVNILWQGIMVEDLLDRAKVFPEATVVIFRAHDGYSTSLPLDYILENDILMAHKMNGVPLPPERGAPFQLVAESKLGYKWIKWITEIELSDDTGYLGFWESRGYSNDADTG